MPHEFRTDSWKCTSPFLRARTQSWPIVASGRQVYRQFGVDPARASERVTVRNFQREVLRELKKIKLAWPDLNYATAPGVLILLPSTPAIAPFNQGPLARITILAFMARTG